MLECCRQQGSSLSSLLLEHSVSFLPQSLALNLKHHPLYSLLGYPTGPHFSRSPGWESLLLRHCDFCPALTSQEVALTPELPSFYLLISVPIPPCSPPLPVTLSPLSALGMSLPAFELGYGWRRRMGLTLTIRTFICSQIPKPTPNLLMVTLP